MSFQVIISKRAQKDVRAILRRMAKVTPKKVDGWQDAFAAALASLGALPMRCPLIKEETKTKGLRHLLFDQYRIIFSILDDEVVWVNHIRHQKQKPLTSDDI